MAVDNTARWMPSAACLSRVDLPWTTDATSTTRAAVRAMEGVCAGCPVRNHCAAYAVEADVTGGFWAGQDRDLLAPRRLDTAGTAYQPALPGMTPRVVTRGAA
jgi:hypothetical protein